MSALAVVLFCAGVSLAILSNFVLYAMIGKINRFLPDNDQIGYLLFYPSKAARIGREYRRYYPKGRLNALRIGLLIAGGALLFGFFFIVR